MRPLSASERVKQSELLLSYKAVRQTVGAMGFILPCALLFLALFTSVPFAPSISEFYHTPAREVLVAIIGAIAVFLMSYKGYAVDADRAERNWAERHLTDRRVSWAAALGALGVAFFPTGMRPDYLDASLFPDGAFPMINSAIDIRAVMEPDALTLSLLNQGTVTLMHGLSALVFFVALAIFCLSNFQRGRNRDEPKSGEYQIYTWCGWILVLCTIVIVALFCINSMQALKGYRDTVLNLKLVFWFEAIGLWAFSISWLTKGEALQGLRARMQGSA